jgi:hypothetical protein
MTTQDALDTFFKSVIGQIREDQGAKGITASGRSSDSLAYGTDASGGQLTGSNYFYWQIVGRKPGKFAPPEAIEQWIRDKGITPNDPKTTIKQLAFLFNRKMATKGTDIFIGKRSGLSFSEIVDKNMSILLGNIAQLKVKEISTFLKAELVK